MATPAAKAEVREALDRVTFWNDTWATLSPTIAGPAGVGLALALPAAFYYWLPPPSGAGVCEPGGRAGLLLDLQLWPALVLVYYIVVTGTVRVSSSPVAAHDPAAAYVAGVMPIKVVAANRAFANTLEQYALLLTASAALVRRVPCGEIGMLPALYATWCVCRVLFLHGYVMSGSGRMVGFPGTFMPTVAALCYAAFLAVKAGALY